MNKEFLKIKGEDLKKGKVPIDIFVDKETTFKEMANLMVDTIIENNRINKRLYLLFL